MDEKELGKRIRRRREALGMSQEELGKKLGITAGTVSRMENGKGGEPKYAVIRSLADALDTSTRWLIDGGSTDFRLALARLEVDPAVRDALIQIAGWFEVADEAERTTFSRNMETMGRMFARRGARIRMLSSDDVVEFEHNACPV